VRLLLALAGWAGCYSPEPQPGAPCPSGVCPEGLTCSPATGTCEVRAIDAALPGDASADAPMFDAGALPMIVQQATSHANNVTTLSATLPTTPAAGHMLVMIGANLSGSITTVSGGSASWTLAASSLINSNIEVWFGVSTGSGATVTIDRPATTASMWMAVSEWSGLATTSPLDVARADAGTGNPLGAGEITTANARDLLLFAATTPVPSSHGSPAPDAWTTMQGVTSETTVQGAWYRIETATGSYSPQVGHTSSDGWEAAVVAFRLAP